MSVTATLAVFTFAVVAFTAGVFTTCVVFIDLAADIRKSRPHRLGAAGRVTHQEGAPDEY